MTVCRSSIRDWLSVLVETIEELSSTTLDKERIRVQKVDRELHGKGSDLSNAVIDVDPAVRISLLSNADGFRKLTTIMLQMDAAESEALSDAEIADAMGEVVNMIAGMVKCRMSEIRHDRNIGLPEYLEGGIEVSNNRESGSVDILIGEVPARIVVTRSKDGPPDDR